MRNKLKSDLSSAVLFALVIVGLSTNGAYSSDEILFTCESADEDHAIQVSRGEVLVGEKPKEENPNEEKPNEDQADSAKVQEVVDLDVELVESEDLTIALIDDRPERVQGFSRNSRKTNKDKSRRRSKEIKSSFEDSIIRIKIQDKANKLIDQIDFFRGKIKSSDSKFEVKYRNGGLLKTHRMTLSINNLTGEGTYKEIESAVFSKKSEKTYRFRNCDQISKNP